MAIVSGVQYRKVMIFLTLYFCESVNEPLRFIRTYLSAFQYLEKKGFLLFGVPVFGPRAILFQCKCAIQLMISYIQTKPRIKIKLKKSKTISHFSQTNALSVDLRFQIT